MRAHITITLDYQAKVETLDHADQLGAAVLDHLRRSLSPELAAAVAAVPTASPVTVRRTVVCARCERAFPAVGPLSNSLGDACACAVGTNARGEKVVWGMYGSHEFDLKLLRFADPASPYPDDALLCDGCVQKMLDAGELVDRQETY